MTQYQAGYEPYVVVRKDAGGWCVSLPRQGSQPGCSYTCVCGRCDERFTGYGGNKAACLFEMYLSGVSFYVLSDHFLIHQSHTYEEEARKNEVSEHTFSSELCAIQITRPKQRRYNRKIHSDFKEETCLRFFPSIRG